MQEIETINDKFARLNDSKSNNSTQSKEVQNIVIDLFRQNFARYQHQLDEWQMARDIRHDVHYPLTYAMQEMYEDAMVDAHLTAIIESRVLRVLNQEFVVNGADGIIDEEKTKLLNKPWFSKIIRYAMESLFYGYNVIYIKDVLKGEIKDIETIPREHFTPEKKWIINNVTDTDDGLKIEEFPNHLIYVQLGEDSIGLLEKASPLTILKRHSWGSWDEFEQRFGLPIMMAKVASSGTKAKREVAKWMQEAARGKGGVFGVQDSLEILSNGQTDSYQVFLEKISSVNAELSKLILGQTMTTEDGSSHSQANVHQKTLDSISQADLNLSLQWLNHKLKPVLIAHGYALSEEDTIDVFEQANPQDRIKIDIPLLQAGYKLSDDYIEKTYHVELVKTDPKEEKKKLAKKDQEKIEEVENFFQ